MAIERVTEEHVRKFQERAREFAKTHPDFNDRMADAARRGLNLAPAHTAEIVRICSPETAYYYADPANESEARSLNVAEGERVNDERAADKIRRTASRLKRHDTFTKIEGKENPTDVYLRGRKYDIQQGLRRR